MRFLVEGLFEGEPRSWIYMSYKTDVKHWVTYGVLEEGDVVTYEPQHNPSRRGDGWNNAVRASGVRDMRYKVIDGVLKAELSESYFSTFAGFQRHMFRVAYASLDKDVAKPRPENSRRTMINGRNLYDHVDAKAYRVTYAARKGDDALQVAASDKLSDEIQKRNVTVDGVSKWMSTFVLTADERKGHHCDIVYKATTRAYEDLVASFAAKPSTSRFVAPSPELDVGHEDDSDSESDDYSGSEEDYSDSDEDDETPEPQVQGIVPVAPIVPVPDNNVVTIVEELIKKRKRECTDAEDAYTVAKKRFEDTAAAKATAVAAKEAADVALAAADAALEAVQEEVQAIKAARDAKKALADAEIAAIKAFINE